MLSEGSTPWKKKENQAVLQATVRVRVPPIRKHLGNNASSLLQKYLLPMDGCINLLSTLANM
jgi:hypothetical protein